MADAPLPADEIARLVEALGEAPAVTYAPPNIFPMSTPEFDRAPALERGPLPAGPLGVYVHVPFCNYKCTFCFYATAPVPGEPEMARYVAAVERELAAIPPGTPLTQLYVGGGTPTTLPPALLDRLLGAVSERVVPGREVSTVECSPESLTDAHVEVLCRRGIGRVSMGVQSTEAEVLQGVNRRHGLADVQAAVARLLAAGRVVNLDLIYGLPGQHADGFRADFELAAALGVHSVTCYNLRVNERTPVARRLHDPERLDVLRLVRWREGAAAVAEACGFEQTRWHTFRRREPATAREDARRFRDVTGWGNQLGAGVSARSRLSDVVYRNDSRYGEYLARVEAGRSPVEEVRRLDEDERRLRHVTLTLGDGGALVRSEYERAFGAELDDDFGPSLARLVAAGVLADDGERVVLTRRGRLVYDLATRALYPERLRRWMDERQALVGRVANLPARR